MTQYTSNFLPWSSISITSEDLYYQQENINNNNNSNSNNTLTPPTSPLHYKNAPTSSNGYFNPSPPLLPNQQQQFEEEEQKQQYYNTYHLQHIPPKINIRLNDFGLSLETNMTDIARLRNYLLSFALQSETNINTNIYSPTFCSSPSPSSSSLSTSGQLILRNKKYRNKPVNLFKRYYELGQQNKINNFNFFFTGPSSSSSSSSTTIPPSLPLFFQQLILRQHTVTACIHTYFDCWTRYFPVFPRQHVLAVLDEPRGLDSIIVNAIACFVLKHMFAHHQYPPALAAIRRDPSKIRDMEEFFFTTAKNALENQLFDLNMNNSDSSNNATTNTMASRYDIFGMILMSYKVDMKKKSIYMAMAVRSLQALQIQPGDDDDEKEKEEMKKKNNYNSNVNPENDQSWKEELDIRLWWMTWMNDFAVYSSGCSASMPFSCCDDDGFMVDPILTQQQQQQHQPSHKKKRRVPKLWSFDCDGASEYGIMVNKHCLSIWRIQAEIVRHQYNSKNNSNGMDGGVVDSALLESFDNQIHQFINQLPLDLQPDTPYDPSPISLVRARVHTELNATKIILHKLYIPDEEEEDSIKQIDLLDNSTLYQWTSLNKCLKAAMDQVNIFYCCVMVYPNELRCGFDRDELWRSTEIISITLDFLNKLSSTSFYNHHHQHQNNESMDHYVKQLILNDVGTIQTLKEALNRSLIILQHTYELRCNNSNFRQLEDWLKERIQHHHQHHLYNNNNNNNNKVNNIPASSQQQQQQPISSPISPVPLLSPSLSTASSSSSSKNSQIYSSISSSTTTSTTTTTTATATIATTQRRKSSSTSAKKRKTSTGIQFVQQMAFSSKPSSKTSSSPTSSSLTSSSSSSSSSLPQINSFSSSPLSSQSSKARFRYFSPKENRGLLFIDENPDTK